MNTWVGTKRGDGLFGRRARVESPCLVRLLICGAFAPDADFVLSGNGLTVKDKEWSDSVLFPQVETLIDMGLDAGQAAEGRQQWLVGRRGIEQLAQPVRCVNSDGAVMKVGDIV